MRAVEVRIIANEAHKRLCADEEPKSEVILLLGSMAINLARIADALEEMAFDDPAELEAKDFDEPAEGE